MRYNVDIEKAYIAGLLHDCAKCLPDDELLYECKMNSIEVTDFEYKSPYLLHGKVGALYARTEFGIDDDEICSSIKYHTTGKPEMSKLEEIVFIADYIEPYRNKADDLDEIRSIVFVDIEKAIYLVCEHTLEYLKANNKPIDKTTVDTFNYYHKIICERKL